ncbi:MAG: hypothetical protein IJA62_01050 [Ruminococcus sp.]|nr:hypothetical protein [Ruminococcus sp.]
MKNVIAFYLCVIMLLSFASCSEETNTNPNTQPTEITTQSESKTKVDVTHNESVSATSPPKSAVFITKNVKRITFYAYYGGGKGSDVPAKHLDEIINWLDSFVIDTDRDFPDLVPPGTNTIYVEIECLDGTIVKKGLDATTVDGITYYIKHNTTPDCYYDIISKTSLN